jgi:glyoxylase I family protein
VRMEHIALNVTDPVSAAEWYCQNLGMRLINISRTPPLGAFVADPNGMMLELYCKSQAGPFNYFALHPANLHIAFAVDDLEGTCTALTAAGGIIEGEEERTSKGDRLIFIRDPWGVTLQLAQRQTPLHNGSTQP